MSAAETRTPKRKVSFAHRIRRGFGGASPALRAAAPDEDVLLHLHHPRLLSMATKTTFLLTAFSS